MAITVERLVELGGKVWERGEMKRVYFNHEELARFYGLAYDGWKFTVDGERVSNSSGHQISSALRNGKFWFDLATGEFASKGMSEKMTEKLIARISEALAVAETEVESEMTKTDEPEVAEAAEEAPAPTEIVANSTAVVASTVPAGAGIRTAVGPGLPPGVKIYTNRKPGYCRHCGKLVPAGQGHLYYIDPDEAYEVSGWIVEHKGSCPTK